MFKLLKSKISVLYLMLCVLLPFVCASCDSPETVRLGDLDSDYTRLGLTKGTIELWEDGMRIDNTSDDFCFEWWYFDGMFDDGSSFVASFYSRIDMDPERPFIKLTITTPDGENIIRDMWGDPADASFSTTECNLNIGSDTRITSVNGTTYTIKSSVEDLAVDLVLNRTVRSFRQETGHILIGNSEEEYLAWFSMVPRGTLSGTITYNGETHEVTGMGYHDHNWGNIPIQKALNGWWWMRGYTDDIAIIGYDFNFLPAFGSKHIPIFGVVNETDILAVGDSNTTVEGVDWRFPDIPEYASVFPNDRIPFGVNITSGECEGATNCIQAKFESETLMEADNLAEMQELPDFALSMMKLLSVDPWYTRFSGTVDIEANYNGWSTSGSGTAIIEFLDLK